ncbi:MAG: VanZ family protein [Actinomycetota bacterium]
MAFLPYLGRALAACAVVLVLAVTLTPAAGMEGRDLDLMPFRSIAETLRNPVDWRVPLAQLGGNMLLFAAVGFLVPVGWGRFGNWRWIGLIALGLGAGIEAGQYLLAFGRVTATDDVILAVAGALFGLGALRILEATRLKPLAPGPLSQSSAELVSI